MRHPALATYLSCLFFAAMAVVAKDLSQYHRMPSQQLVFFRSLVNCLMMLPAVVYAARTRGPEVRRAMGGLVLRGIVGAISMVAYFMSIERISVSGAAMTAYTSPIWSALVAGCFLHERTPRRLFWAFPLSFVGVLLAAGVGASSNPSGASLAGYGLGLLSALMSGVAYATLRRLRGLPPALMVFSLSFMGMLAVTPVLGGIYRPPSQAEWGLLVLLGTLGGIAQWLMTLGYRYMTAARASTLGLATVGATALLAALVLKERLLPLEWVGMGLIVSGSALATSSREE